LDSTTVNDGHDGDIYCRADYNAKFGMKGYGFGQGAGTLMSVSHVKALLKDLD
jgi:cysteine/glycine-rich protein